MLYTVRRSAWLGLEKKSYNLTYIDDADNSKFHEAIQDVLAYSDGTEFDLDDRGSYLGANVLRGPCFGLAFDDGLAIRDYKCTRELGIICMWTGNNARFYHYVGYVGIYKAFPNILTS